jgi:diguanylate cyclase (GGDEF)-like protein/PAS domain S-box-containing protein
VKFFGFLPTSIRMDPQPLPSSALRRSDRVSIAFPLEVAGIDLTGKRFSERTKTTTVSRFGCCLPLPKYLQAGQSIELRRLPTNERVVGRVIGSVGPQRHGQLYGVGTQDSCERLWGIHFISSFPGQLVDNLNDAVYFVNRDRKITYWNQAAENLSGYSSGEVMGKNCFESLAHVDAFGESVGTNGCMVSAVLADGKNRQSEIFLRHKGGYRLPVSVRVLPMRNGDGMIVGAMQVYSDARKKTTENRVVELERLAFRDTLTGLPNRRFMEMKVEQGLEEHIVFDRLYGLLLFDLDRFKSVNDSHGHDVGDALLKAVSATLSHGLRPMDIVGRWGGEEFLVLMPDLDAIGLGDLAERCRALIAQSSVPNSSNRVSVTASIGATVLGHADTAESAIRRADELMYQSKKSGGDRTTAG